jgi:hypothetical protein
MSSRGAQRRSTKVNKKIRCITQTGLAAKTLNNELDMTVIYKVRGWAGGWYAVATSTSTADEFDTELQARMVNA